MSKDCPGLARRVRWTPRLLLSLLFLLPLFIGCKGWDTPWSGSSFDDDPLMPGGKIPEQGKQPPQPLPPANTQTAQNTQPPPPQSWAPSPAGTTGGTTPAALMGSGARPSDPPNDPRFAGPGGGIPADQNGWRATPSAPAATPGGAQLHSPEAVDPGRMPVSASTGAQQITLAGGVPRGDSIAQCYAQLKSYGVNWNRSTLVNADTDEYKFECAIPNRKSPKTSKLYEGRGIGPDGAMRAVIDEISKQPRPSGN